MVRVRAIQSEAVEGKAHDALRRLRREALTPPGLSDPEADLGLQVLQVDLPKLDGAQEPMLLGLFDREVERRSSRELEAVGPDPALEGLFAFPSA